MSKLIEIFTILAVFFTVSHGFTWQVSPKLYRLEPNLDVLPDDEIFSPPEEINDMDYSDLEICPENARDVCYFSKHGAFTGHPVKCNEHIICGETPVKIPTGTECEWDPVDPAVATKVCIEGKCVSFNRARGDC